MNPVGSVMGVARLFGAGAPVEPVDELERLSTEELRAIYELELQHLRMLETAGTVSGVVAPPMLARLLKVL